MAVRDAIIHFGEVLAKHFGIPAINKTGGTLDKGTLVYISGWDSTSKRFKISKATATGGALRFATAVTTSAVLNDGATVARPAANVTGLNTAGKAAGDAVYLDTTPGGYTYNAPKINYQALGYVSKVDATDGAIEFDLAFAGAQPSVVAEEGTVQYVEVPLTLANMLALRATPITMVVAPGVGKAIEFVSGTLLFDYGSAAFTVTNAGDDMQLRWKDGTGAKASEIIEPTGLLDVAGDGAQAITKLAAAAPILKAVFENQPLVLHNIGAADYTVGTGGTCRARIAYRIVATGW